MYMYSVKQSITRIYIHFMKRIFLFSRCCKERQSLIGICHPSCRRHTHLLQSHWKQFFIDPGFEQIKQKETIWYSFISFSRTNSEGNFRCVERIWRDITSRFFADWDRFKGVQAFDLSLGKGISIISSSTSFVLAWWICTSHSEIATKECVLCPSLTRTFSADKIIKIQPSVLRTKTGDQYRRGTGDTHIT